jgi:ketosteroid isomerase-like protein
MTASRSNLESLQRWYETYEGRGIEPAEDLIDELFDPEVEFSPWLAREVERRTFYGPDGIRTFFRELSEMLGEVRYGVPEYRSLSEDVIVVLTRLEGAGRASAIPVGQDLGLVYEFRGGLVKRLTAFGSHEEALRAAKEKQHAQA